MNGAVIGINSAIDRRCRARSAAARPARSASASPSRSTRPSGSPGDHRRPEGRPTAGSGRRSTATPRSSRLLGADAHLDRRRDRRPRRPASRPATSSPRSTTLSFRAATGSSRASAALPRARRCQVTYVRDGQTKTVTVTLGSDAKPPDPSNRRAPRHGSGGGFCAFRTANRSPCLSSRASTSGAVNTRSSVSPARLDLLPRHRRGHRGRGSCAQRVRRHGGLRRVVLRPVDEHLVRPQGLGHPGHHEVRVLGLQPLRQLVRVRRVRSADVSRSAA